MSKLGEVLLLLAERGAELFDKQKVWAAVFGSEAYKDVNFRKACSDLLKLIERFMAHDQLDQDESSANLHTIKFAVKNKMNNIGNDLIQAFRNQQNTHRYYSPDFYRNLFDIESQYYQLIGFNQKPTEKSNVEVIADGLDQYYWIEKIKLYITIISQKRTGNFDYKFNFMDEVLRFLEKHPVEESPTLAVYYYSLLTFYEPDNTAHYYNLKRSLGKYALQMPQKEAIEIFDSALHYCTGRLNRGDQVFAGEYFELFDNALQSNIFVVNNEFAHWRFNNIIGVALRLGKSEWAENFAENYKDYLPQYTRQNTYTFNLARVYRYQKKYDRVISLLKDVEYEDMGYNLIAKVTLLITYYELGQIDTLDYFIQSFNTFLRRQKNLPTQRKNSYLNLIKFVRRLIRLMPGDKKAIEKLKEEINQERAGTVNHEWLLEKLGEL